jgi:simple sugar transport system substrate-binding protein
MPPFTRRRMLATLAASPIALAVPAWAQGKEPLKIGFVYVSPIGDAGWTHQHDIARIAMEKNLAGRVTTKFVENVPEGADAERVIRELAQSGQKLIFTTSFGYMNPTIRWRSSFRTRSSSMRRATRRRATSARTTRASTKDAIWRASSPAG